MMANPLETPVNQSKLGAAILAACIVQTLHESDPTFQNRFLDRLKNSYADVRDLTDTDCLELLNWTREILKADDLFSLIRS